MSGEILTDTRLQCHDKLGNILRLGLNFVNILCTAFTCIDPKIVERYWQLDWVLTLWGATGVKAVHKYVHMFMKLTLEGFHGQL